MQASIRGIAEIIAHEGIVPYRYRDQVGIDTWGIGHTAAAGDPDPATFPFGVAFPLDAVIETFIRDLARHEQRVREAVRVPVSQHEFDALVSFDFNTGGIDRAELTAALNAGDRVRAADRFMGWAKPAAVVPRRRQEQRLFATGMYAADGSASVYPADAEGRVLLDRRSAVAVEPIVAAIRAR